jgi:type I restriction enzyme S subunit
MNAVNLIAEHLDIWTTAEKPKKTEGRGRGKKANGKELCGIKKLRELILDLAVRGKLVPQDPEDEPASLLLEKIAEEKARLLKEGKIKKQKKLAEITEEEKPFGLPDGWEWARLDAITSKITDGDHKTPPRILEGSRLLSAKNVRDGYLDFDNCDFISEQHYSKSRERCLPEPGDLLIVSVGGTIGRTSLVPDDSDFALVKSVALIKPLLFSSSYLNHAMNSDLLQSSIHGRKRGGAQPCLYLSEIRQFMFSLPPLAEQHRIVAKVDELMALCDQLEQQQNASNATRQTLLQTLLAALVASADHQEFSTAWERIATHFDLLFSTEQAIDQLKQTILQLAVMGKLVPQNQEDEPASVLLKKIAREKARLLKEGKIKKQKKLPEITEEEKPFALPEGWEWVRLGDFGRVFSGNSFKSEDFNRRDGVKVIKITNAGVGKLIETEDYLPNVFLKKYESYIVNKNDLILALTRPYISTGLKVSKCPAKYHNSLLNQRVAAVRLYTNEEYIFIYMQSLFVLDLYKEKFSSTGLQPNLKISDVTNLLVPIAPEAEQHRIVTKIDELMALCDQLKARLHDAQTTKLQLADTVVQQAVA